MILHHVAGLLALIIARTSPFHNVTYFAVLYNNFYLKEIFVIKLLTLPAFLVYRNGINNR